MRQTQSNDRFAFNDDVTPKASLESMAIIEEPIWIRNHNNTLSERFAMMEDSASSIEAAPLNATSIIIDIIDG